MTEPSLLYLTLSNARLSKRWLRACLEKETPEAGTIPFELLSHIDTEGNSQMELAGRLHCSKQEISRLIQKAVANGWVDIRPDENDKRAKRVGLSQKALEALAKAQDFYCGMEMELLAGLTTAEKDALTASAQVLSKRLHAVLDNSNA